jgi:acyl-CoA thioester hydrolase
MPQTLAHPRTRYPWFIDVPTRFSDNDQYGHMNNAVYLSFFDTAISLLLARELGYDFGGDRYDAVVENHCSFLREIRFPEVVTAGVGVGHIGRSSARLEVALFVGDEPEARAQGWFVQVRCDRATSRPVELEDTWRAAFERLRVREGQP